MQQARKSETPAAYARSSASAKPPRPFALPEVASFLQPIVSVRQQKTRLVEALARGIEPDGTIRPPLELFAEAARHDLSRELERASRHAAFASFLTLPEDGRPILSLNTDASLVCEGERGAERIAEEAAAAGVAPHQIALEILEFAVTSPQQLPLFCKRARSLGFLLALDDVGTGHSNLERIPHLEPDIIKIDRVLVHGIHENYRRREVFRSLVSLSHQIGALSVAEGVEDERDVLAALSLGCDLFQGYYFGRPANVRTTQTLANQALLAQVGTKYAEHAQQRLNERRSRQWQSEQAIQALLSELQRTQVADAFDAVLHRALERVPYIEALYVLDVQGQQVTDTVHRVTEDPRGLFAPAPMGTDQSLKQYFLMLNAGLDRYTSHPYVSSATGKFCITMSRFFQSRAGQTFVLCCDLTVPSDQ